MWMIDAYSPTFISTVFTTLLFFQSTNCITPFLERKVTCLRYLLFLLFKGLLSLLVADICSSFFRIEHLAERVNKRGFRIDALCLVQEYFRLAVIIHFMYSNAM